MANIPIRARDILDFLAYEPLIMSETLPSHSVLPKQVITYIDAEPKLPPIDIRLKMKPGFSLEGDLIYTASISYTEHQRLDESPKINGRSNSLNFKVDFGNIIRGGLFKIEFRIPWRNTDGRVGTAMVAGISSIRGKNPSKSLIRKELGEGNSVMFAIVWQESKFRQFDRHDLPLFGPPNGFGVMQIDTPPATAQEVWDWKANIRSGKNLYLSKKGISDQHAKNVKSKYPDATDLTSEQEKLQIYRMYNGGYYWRWDDAAKEWTKTIEEDTYADQVHRVQQAIDAGFSINEWD